MTRQRINQASMQDNDWTAFTNAVKVLKGQTTHPNYDDFAMVHSMTRHKGQAHMDFTFLPWHREYLLTFEDALVAIDPSVTLPYWDWANEPMLPDALSNAAEWGVTRAMKNGDLISPKRKDDVTLALSKTMYAAFSDRINGPHGAVHMQIGGVDEQTGIGLGEMARIERSPRDVLFWLHHAFLDKLWDDWSKVIRVSFRPTA